MMVERRLKSEQYQFFQSFLKEHAGIILEAGKEELLRKNLDPLFRSHEIESFDHLQEKLQARYFSSLHRDVIALMTTNETSFFRDAHPFEAFRKVLLPELAKKRSNEKALEIWSAACSSGQEPYSLAIILRQYFPELSSWNVRIIGTDLSYLALEKAKKGIYSSFELGRGLPPEMLERYFERVDDQNWKIKTEVHRMVEFREMNLTAAWQPLPKMDLIFLRNVLIYFDPATRKKILKATRQTLRPDGYLIMGGQETVGGLDEYFKERRVDRTLIYQPKT